MEEKKSFPAQDLSVQEVLSPVSLTVLTEPQRINWWKEFMAMPRELGRAPFIQNMIYTYPCSSKNTDALEQIEQLLSSLKIPGFVAFCNSPSGFDEHKMDLHLYFMPTDIIRYVMKDKIDLLFEIVLNLQPKEKEVKG